MSYYEDSPVFYHQPTQMAQKQQGDLDLMFPLFSHPVISTQHTSTEQSGWADSDIEDEASLFEEERSGRTSPMSPNGRSRSQVTVSTVSEIMTPDSARQSRNISSFHTASTSQPSMSSGVKGPHLFSNSSSPAFGDSNVLEMSPIEPMRLATEMQMKTPTQAQYPNNPVYSQPSSPLSSRSPMSQSPIAFEPVSPVHSVENGRHNSHRSSGVNASSMIIDPAAIQAWSATEVGHWMYTLGFEDTTVDRFQLHDITGPVLLELKFDDLRELGIPSFHKRHQIWTQICALRGSDPILPPQQVESIISVNDSLTDGATDSHFVWPPISQPVAYGSMDDLAEECISPVPLEMATNSKTALFDPVKMPSLVDRRRACRGEVQTEESSIVAIEQLLPKPHKCTKGERCGKWRRQQRLIRRLHDEHGIVVPPTDTATRIIIPENRDLLQIKTSFTPVDRAHLASPGPLRMPLTPGGISEIGPSVVASSDILGPGQMPQVALHESALRRVLKRDPQENVRQFLAMQHVEELSPVDEPAMEDDDLEPPPSATLSRRSAATNLSRLEIPSNGFEIPEPSTARPQSAHIVMPKVSYHSLSPNTRDMAPPSNANTASVRVDFSSPPRVMTGSPLCRNLTRSVPSMSVMAKDPVVRSATALPSLGRPIAGLSSLAEEQLEIQQDSSSAGSSAYVQRADTPATSYQSSPDLISASLAESTSTLQATDPQEAYPGVRHLGWIKKRKMKFLRHEWQDRHMRLRDGTLSLHHNALPACNPVDSLSIDDYTVACATSQTKRIAAKLKNLRLNSKNDNPNAMASFPFQLVATAPGTEATPTTRLQRTLLRSPKSHNFAVTSSDDRIEWMREIMLAKAIRAKCGDGSYTS